ncbi:MAG: hypothetical protein WC476_05245 [Phycisphaerae bacterium]|jgi:hypothetical protein
MKITKKHTGYFYICALIFCVLGCSGCESLRFAPTETQKQNAWLHNRTTAIAVEAAKSENSSEQLQALAKLSELQSRAFVSYAGLPREFPQAETADDVLGESNQQLAQIALSESVERPDAWQLADSALELAIGISALLGGVYGTRALRFLKDAQIKSKALKEIIEGNELFKKQNESSIAAFKQAQQNQSPETRQIVAEIKA